MCPEPEYITLHGRLSNNNHMSGVLGIGGGTANYENLINKPSINDVTLVGNKNTEDLGLVAPSDLSEVAFSGDYDDLSDKPSIPSKTSDLTNDSGFITMEDMTASNVEYDNTVSGITADDVQGAVDNIVSNINSITADITLINTQLPLKAVMTTIGPIVAGGTFDFSSYADGSIIFIYRPADSNQSDYMGIYIKSSTWSRLLAVKAVNNITTSGTVLTNGTLSSVRGTVISM